MGSEFEGEREGYRVRARGTQSRYNAVNVSVKLPFAEEKTKQRAAVSLVLLLLLPARVARVAVAVCRDCHYAKISLAVKVDSKHIII